MEADVGGTNMEDYAEEAMHMKIIIMNITIMIFIMVISNGRMML